MLYRYGIKVGGKLMLHGRVPQSLRYLIRPVNYWRTIEYQLVLDAAQFQSSDRILDIGSPKLLSLYLAKVIGAQVFSTDVDSYFVDDFNLVRHLEGVSSERLRISVEDGRKLSFADNYFDKVYSISVIEHIPDTGDTECVKDIARVLAPGGKCLITVPFLPESKIEYMEQDKFYWAKHSVESTKNKVFYQRRYSEQDLFERIIKPSGLKLTKLRYVGEKVMTRSDRELSEFLPAFTGPLQPLMSKLFHSPPVDSWRDLKKPLCALIVLEK